jgi:hypothetical protein
LCEGFGDYLPTTKGETMHMTTFELKEERRAQARLSRRFASEDRYLARLEKREAIADQMIGELNSGKLYVYPVGGKYREGTRSELIAFLIRNNYA